MNRLKYMIYQFMQGRRGPDAFSRFLLISALVLILISGLLVRVRLLYLLAYYTGATAFVYGYFRMLSRNLYKRELENQKFLAWYYKVTKGKTLKQMMYARKNYAYFKCPRCGQKMRAPKGKGKIKVFCNRCNENFIKKV